MTEDSHADNQRRLVCQRCGRRQDKAGRVISEAERELSYRWCVDCLDEAGPDPEPAGDLAGFFRGLAAHLVRVVNDDSEDLVGVLVTYHGSKTADHGTYRVLHAASPLRLVIDNDTGRRLEVNRHSVTVIHPERR